MLVKFASVQRSLVDICFYWDLIKLIDELIDKNNLRKNYHLYDVKCSQELDKLFYWFN